MRPLALLLPPLIAAIGLIAPAGAGAAACRDTDAIPTADRIVPAVLATICLANEQRAAAGVPRLELDQGLTAVAVGYARRMVAEEFYKHLAPDGTLLADRLAVIGYHPYAAGENMYWGDLHLATPAEAVKGWLRSKKHRGNLLDPRYMRIGVGIAMGTPLHDERPSATYVADFDSGPGGTASDGSQLGPAVDTIVGSAPSSLPPPAAPARTAALRARQAVRAWFEAARLGDGRTFCRLEDNRFLKSQYRLIGSAGRAACVAAFTPISALPEASQLRLTGVRTEGTRATMIVAAKGQRVAMVLRKWNGHWKLDAVTR